MPDRLLAAAGFTIVHQHIVPPKSPNFSDVPMTIHEKIQKYLHKKFNGRLFSHQGQAAIAAIQGNNVVLATSTASGKTLSFAIPVFQKLLINHNSRAMFFYPTKALAGDQLRVLEETAAELGLNGCIFRFDGDTQEKERKRALRYGRVLICTPDVLHATILKRNLEQDYATLLSNLSIVVLDEAHIYSGAFGSNMAFVMRRLRQVCLRKDNKPQFIAASATSSNPGKHLEMLTGVPFQVIDESVNGSPHSGRIFLMVDTENNDIDEATCALVAGLVKEDKRFIVFCHSRRSTELFYHELLERYPHLRNVIMPYRSGYEVNDRRQIETGIREGSLKGIISTSALELGVDLPNLEYCLHLGIPSSAMSFWQRSGRVGRQNNVQGKIIIIPSVTGNAVDVYYRNHPERLYERPLEELVLHLDNRSLLLSHFACARFESDNYNKPNLHPEIFGKQFAELAQKADEIDLPDDDILRSHDPHANVNIRCIDDATYEIFISGGQRLGTITYSQMLREAYEGAVYRHMGYAYRVQRLRFNDRIVEVKHERPQAMTSPMGYVHVKERSSMSNNILRRKLWVNMLDMSHTTMAVVTSITGYREKIGSNWVSKRYHRPLQRRVYSEGIMFKFLPEFGEYSYDGLNALAHALSIVYSIEKPCDSSEIATHTVIRRQDNTATICIFDTTSGGLGISTSLFDRFDKLLPRVREMLTTCEHCDTDSWDRGCPVCIQVPRWYEDNDRLSKSEALKILDQLEAMLKNTPCDEYLSPLYRQRITGDFIYLHETLDDTGETDERYGVALYNPGSIIQTRSGMKGEVLERLEENNGIRYRVSFENGKTNIIRDIGLKLISGTVSYLCLNCGSSFDQKASICQVCNCDLF